MEDLSNVAGEGEPEAIRKILVQEAMDKLEAAKSIRPSFRVNRMIRDGEFDHMEMDRLIAINNDGEEPSQGE